jgi:hypothetical protein
MILFIVQIEWDFGEGEGPIIFKGSGETSREAFNDAIDYLSLTPGISIKIIEVNSSPGKRG